MLVISRFGFEGLISVLIALYTFYRMVNLKQCTIFAFDHYTLLNFDLIRDK